MKTLVLLNRSPHVGRLTLGLCGARYIQYGVKGSRPLSDLQPKDYALELARRVIHEYLDGLERLPLPKPLGMSACLDVHTVETPVILSTHTIFVDGCGEPWHDLRQDIYRERLLGLGGRTGTFYTSHVLHSLRTGVEHTENRETRALFYPMTSMEVERVLQRERRPLRHGVDQAMLSWIETVDGSLLAAIGCCPGTVRLGLRSIGEHPQEYETGEL